MTVQPNTIKNSFIQEEIPVIPEAEEIKKTERPKPEPPPKTNKKEKFRKFTGVFLVTASVFMLFAFISFLLNWKQDFSEVKDFSQSFHDLKNEHIHNWMGLGGAGIAYLFIYKGFGIASFFFVLLFTMYGLKLSSNYTFLPIRKTTLTLSFFIIWLSVILGLFFEGYTGTISILSGRIGYFSQEWLRQFMGYLGVLILLTFTMLGYLILSFNIRLDIPDFKRKYKENEIIPKKTEEPFLFSPVKEMVEDIDLKDPENLIIEEKEEMEEEIEFVTKPIAENPNDDVEFEIEILKEEEEYVEGKDKFPLKDLPPYDPRKDLSRYKFPPVDLLNDYGEKEREIDPKELEDRKNQIIQTLRNYAIEIDKIKATVGPTVTLYEIVPVAGVRISRIKNLEDDIALSLSALGIRIIAPIPGKGTIGIEVPNQKPEIVSLRGVISSAKFQNAQMELPFALGRTISNEVYIADLVKLPHLLIAGATGQGKSVGINVIITSLLYKKHPSEVKFVLVDPKKVELSLFQKIEKHFLAKLPDSESAIVTDVEDVKKTLMSLTSEMDQRYTLLKDAHTRNIVEYNTKFVSRKLNPESGHRYLPYIILVIDELADLMMTAGKEIEMPIARLAQLARAIGIHLIIATQRPSVNIITGSIKANFPARIAFKVSATVDSRTIIDYKGAEQLVGRGDMLFSTGSDTIRIQCALIETDEVEKVTNFISEQQAPSEAHVLPEVKTDDDLADMEMNSDDLDPMFEEAARMVVQHQQGSTSLLQRRLKLGYNRAGRIIDQLESAGVVGPFEGSKARIVKFQDEYSLEQFLKDYMSNKES